MLGLLDSRCMLSEIWRVQRERYDNVDERGRRGMRRLLNSLYILDETAYLTIDGENVVCRTEEYAGQ